ncbi:AAA family ATPase [Myxococcota bacterium]|nr:AAA family ATPase [Myxococcota bacterium]
MIERVRLFRFKGHRETVVRLGRLTALVGPNGAGKTSFLQALHCLRRLEERDLLKGFQGAYDPLQFVRKGETSVAWGLEGVAGVAKEPWAFGLEFQLPKSKNWMFDCSVDWSWQGVEEKQQQHGTTTNIWAGGSGEAPPKATPSVFRELLCRSVLLKMQAGLLAEVSFSPDEIPRVAEDGRYLASAIAYLKTYEEAAFERLQEAVRRVIPQVERLRVKRTKRHFVETRYVSVEGRGVPIQETREAVGDELVFDMRGVGEITAKDVSEGTLLAVGLLTVLMSPACPSLVLFDDVEQALHPKAQRELIKVLKGILKEREELQIIVTTHSPYIVDALETSSVCVMAMDAKGEVKAHALSEHPNAARFLDILTTGEFLSAEGEDWVLDVEEEGAGG